MKLTFDELVLINNAKWRLRFWWLFRLVLLTLPITFLSMALYFIIIAKYFSAALFLGSVSGVLFRFIYSNWKGLKRDLLLSKIEVSS